MGNVESHQSKALLTVLPIAEIKITRLNTKSVYYLLRIYISLVSLEARTSRFVERINRSPGIPRLLDRRCPLPNDTLDIGTQLFV
jgi:hypothetical protein